MLAPTLIALSFAGVANIGSDRNWTGSHFDQANWYVFGRMAWDPMLSSRDIAESFHSESSGRIDPSRIHDSHDDHAELPDDEFSGLIQRVRPPDDKPTGDDRASFARNLFSGGN